MSKTFIALAFFGLGICVTNIIYSTDIFWENDEIKKSDLARVSYLVGCIENGSAKECKEKALKYEQSITGTSRSALAD